MEQRANFLTLATPNLDAARAFYIDGLGWTPAVDVPGEIIFFQIGHGLMLGLYEGRHFARDLHPTPESAYDSAEPPPTASGLTLSYNVDSPAEVDTVVAQAVSAGAMVIKDPQFASFGGYHGHFADPNGVIWEVAHNPGWRVDEDGKVHLEAP